MFLYGCSGIVLEKSLRDVGIENYVIGGLVRLGLVLDDVIRDLFYVLMLVLGINWSEFGC